MAAEQLFPPENDPTPTPEAAPEVHQPQLFFKRYYEEPGYFEPRSFETTTLYERLGVNAYKKAWAAFAHITMPKADLTQAGLPRISDTTDRMQRLEAMHRQTAIQESVHVSMAAMLNLLAGSAYAIEASVAEEPMPTSTRLGVLAVFGVVQVAGNFYPILTQRYNRLRVNKVIRAAKRQQAGD